VEKVVLETGQPEDVVVGQMDRRAPAILGVLGLQVKVMPEELITERLPIQQEAVAVLVRQGLMVQEALAVMVVRELHQPLVEQLLFILVVVAAVLPHLVLLPV
jgi:hypothetical protein